MAVNHTFAREPGNNEDEPQMTLEKARHITEFLRGNARTDDPMRLPENQITLLQRLSVEKRANVVYRKEGQGDYAFLSTSLSGPLVEEQQNSYISQGPSAHVYASTFNTHGYSNVALNHVPTQVYEPGISNTSHGFTNTNDTRYIVAPWRPSHAHVQGNISNGSSRISYVGSATTSNGGAAQSSSASSQSVDYNSAGIARTGVGRTARYGVGTQRSDTPPQNNLSSPYGGNYGTSLPYSNGGGSLSETRSMTSRRSDRTQASSNKIVGVLPVSIGGAPFTSFKELSQEIRKYNLKPIAIKKPKSKGKNSTQVKVTRPDQIPRSKAGHPAGNQTDSLTSHPVTHVDRAGAQPTQQPGNLTNPVLVRDSGDITTNGGRADPTYDFTAWRNNNLGPIRE